MYEENELFCKIVLKKTYIQTFKFKLFLVIK